MIKNSLFIVALLFMVSCSTGQNQTKTEQLSPTVFLEKISNEKQVQLVDVRTREEFENGYIENAINIDWNGANFEEEIKQLDKDKPVYVYCLGGGRSAQAVNSMKKQGFSNIYELSGGMMAWRSAGLEEVNKIETKSMSIDEYKKIISSKKIVLVDFYADWCSPCKKMAPYLQKISDEFEEILVVKINVDQHKELCKKLNISGLPVLKLYNDNKIAWENEGFVDEKTVREKLNEQF